MRTFFAFSRSSSEYLRKALMTTWVLPGKYPFQVSVNPPGSSGVFPCFSSPCESVAEAGSCTIPLHRFPREVIYFAFCEFRAGCALAKEIGLWSLEKEKTRNPNIPRRPCPPILPFPPVKDLKCYGVCSRERAKH